MKTFYNLLYADNKQFDLDDMLHLNINEDVRKSFASIKRVVLDIGLFVVGFVAIVWVFGMLAGY